MDLKYKKLAFASFMIGYLVAYYLILWLGNTLYATTVASSMDVLGNYQTKLKIALLGLPIVAAFFGSGVARVFIFSYTSMGSHRLTPARFFFIGWVSFCIANALVTSFGLQLLVNKGVGQQWLQQIGQVGFNIWYFLLAPTIGFAGGTFMNILTFELIQAQNS